jgi:hypothetical protein
MIFSQFTKGEFKGKSTSSMGGCCSRGAGGPGQPGPGERDNIASLIRTENITAEAMRKIVGPPAPLLKEIKFAAIEDNDDDDADEDESTDGGDGHEKKK